MKKLNVKVQPVEEKTNAEQWAEQYSLKEQLISDLTGLEKWDVKRAPCAIYELAEHLIECGWKR